MTTCVEHPTWDWPECQPPTTTTTVPVTTTTTVPVTTTTDPPVTTTTDPPATSITTLTPPPTLPITGNEEGPGLTGLLVFAVLLIAVGAVIVVRELGERFQ